MKKIFFLFILLSLVIIAGCSNGDNENGIKAVVFKSSYCGCCELYASELGNRGFDVEFQNMENIDSIKNEYGIPLNIQSCHTTVIDGYFIEGHIPFEAIQKLLEERPDIKGIALPGMPSGSPGMPGSKMGEFTIYAIAKDGSQSTFMTI